MDKLLARLMRFKLPPNMAYKFRNIRAMMIGWRQNFQAILSLGVLATSLSFVVIHNGVARDLGVVSRRIVTTAGVNYLASTFTGTGAPANFNYHDAGTGTTAAAIGDTAMQTAYGGARATGTQSNPSANIYRSVGTVSFTSTLAITEWGIFSASSAGTLLDHFVFSAINVVNGDSIQGTFNLTLTAGS